MSKETAKRRISSVSERNYTFWSWILRSRHQRCSIKKGVLRNFSKFTGKHLCQSLFFNKVAGQAWILIFLWCIVTELSFSSNFWKDDDLLLYLILNALSRTRFILLVSLRLCNIQPNGKYPNCDSIKAFITILFYQRLWKEHCQQEH